MVEAVLVTLPPVVFLAALFGSGAAWRRKQIDIDGEPPIDRRLFYASKYAIPTGWALMALHAWDGFSAFRDPVCIKWIGLVLWFGGFGLMFAGRFELGSSFRMGSPKESTQLKTDGLFRLSRNPMYVGVFATLTGSVLYTLNPLALFLLVFVVAVHHRIILAEEKHLERTFGQAYADYSRRVRRYL